MEICRKQSGNLDKNRGYGYNEQVFKEQRKTIDEE